MNEPESPMYLTVIPNCRKNADDEIWLVIYSFNFHSHKIVC